MGPTLLQSLEEEDTGALEGVGPRNETFWSLKWLRAERVPFVGFQPHPPPEEREVTLRTCPLPPTHPYIPSLQNNLEINSAI